MKKMRLKIQNLKLSVKLISIIIFACLVLLVTEIIERQEVYDAYDEQLYLKTMQICVTYGDQLEMEINKIENLSLSIIGNLGLQEKLITYKNEKNEFDHELRNEISTYIESYYNVWERKARIAIYPAFGTRVIGTNDMKINMEEYLQTAKDKEGRSTVLALNNKIVLYREIRRIPGLLLDHLGVLFIELDMDTLMKDMMDSYAKLNIVPDVFIFDKETCIYSSLNSADIPPIVDHAMLNDDYLIVPNDSPDLGWVFIVRIPYSEINESVRQADLNATIVCIIVAAIVGIFCSIIVCSLMPHINLLMKKFELFGSGELYDPTAYPSYEGRMDEFGRLHDSFDKMAQEYQRLTQESYQNMLLLKEAQFQQLQQQIRPHFLFNTLSTIVWTAAENHDMETARIADALGKILRSSFRNKNSMITVREEIKVVREYLYIQNLRYKDRLNVEEVLGEEVLDVKIPSFTIQPIVENVIIHVVEKSLELCIIKIHGRVNDDYVEIMIEDNGGRLDENILKKIENGELRAKGNGVGLSNVDARIKLAFSKEYGLSIFREKGCSRVVIKLPYTVDEKKEAHYDKGDVSRR